MKMSLDPIWSVGKDFTLLDYNESCKYMSSYYFNREVVIGAEPAQMFNEATEQEWMDCYSRALQGEYFSKEFKLAAGMEDHYYDISFNPVTVNELIEGIAIFARDITSHKRTEKQLSYKVNELNTFMYKATHDLRSPLVSLIGLVHLAQAEPDVSPVLKQYFDMIEKSVTKMDKLLVDLVSITNVSQGKINSSKVDFTKMVNEIIDSLKHYSGFAEIQIKKEIKETSVHTDEKLLYSVLQNLIDNAIKYRKTNSGFEPEINISIEQGNRSVIINVSDNGIGIPMKSQEKVFDMFYRATSNSVGTGLGLYIVKSAVEKMGGKISLSSRESTGTSVFIVLPDLAA